MLVLRILVLTGYTYTVGIGKISKKGLETRACSNYSRSNYYYSRLYLKTLKLGQDLVRRTSESGIYVSAVLF